MTLPRSARLILVLIAVVQGRLAAQRGGTILKPAICPAVQGLFGERVPAPKSGVQGLMLPGQSGITLTTLPREVKQKGLPIRDLVGAVVLNERPRASAPVLLLQLHVVDTTERTIEQRQLQLTLEDSTHIDLGSMNAFRLSKPGAKKVEQNLTANVPPMQFRAVARSATVIVQLGDVLFPLTDEQLDGLRALYAVAVCGSQQRP